MLLLWGCGGAHAEAPVIPNVADAAAVPSHIKYYKVKPANAGLLDIVSGPDGALWFTERTSSKVGRLLNGHFKYFKTPTNDAQPAGITVGPDGALWFTEEVGAVARITTAGKVTEFPVSHPAYAITSGFDGDLWFTENDGQKNWIGRLTPDGQQLAEFEIPSNNNALEAGIAVSRDGMLWSTLMQTNEVAKSTTFGKIHVFKNHDRDTQPFPLVSNGGNLFTGEKHGVAMITAQGAFKEYPLPSGSAVTGITKGAARSIWFVVNQGNYIGTIVDSQVKLYKTGPPSSQGFWDVTLGSDDNLWFTDTVGNRIGRFITPPS